jgi:hypothetical protein
MPHIADLPELLLAANDGIVTLHQLPGVYHADNVGPMASLQILQVIPVYIVLVLPLTLV